MGFEHMSSVKGRTLEERFWEKVDKRADDECWEWRATKLKSGYGNFRLKKHHVSAHRMAYYLTNGTLPADNYICHTCDNRACCNPSHLWAGTNADNMEDMAAKGRRHSGENHMWSKLTWPQVVAMRQIWKGGGVTQAELGNRFGVSRSLVSEIVRNKIWIWYFGPVGRTGGE